MPYAAEGIISRDPIDGGIEITESQYLEALEGLMKGWEVTIDGGFQVAPPAEPAPEEDPKPEPQQITILAPRDYLKRFTLDEYASARSGSIGVQYALDNLIAAQFIDLKDPDVVAGLDLMIAEGIITEERKAQLLAPVEQE